MRDVGFNPRNAETFKHHLKVYEQMLDTGESLYLEAEDFIEIADYYMSKDMFQAAHRCLEYALKLFPTDLWVQTSYVRSFLDEGNVVHARVLADQLTETEDYDVRYLLGELLMAEGQYRKAFKHFAALVESYDEEEKDELLSELVELFFHYDQPMLAQQWMTQEGRTYASPQITYAKAEGLVRKGKFNQALEELQKILESDAFDTLAWNLSAECYMYLGRYDLAVESVDYALALSPDLIQAKRLKANVLIAQRKTFEAELTLREIIKDSPEDWLSCLSLANILIASNEERSVHEGLACLKQAEPFMPKDSGLYQDCISFNAVAHAKMGEVLEAERWLTKFVADETGLTDFNITRASVAAYRGAYDDMRHYLQKAEQAEDCNDYHLLRIGSTLYEHSFYSPAVKILQPLSRKASVKAEVLPYLAFCYKKLEQPKEYIRALRRAVKYNPEGSFIVLGQFFPGLLPEQYVEAAVNS